jgi:hypothetical protein
VIISRLHLSSRRDASSGDDSERVADLFRCIIRPLPGYEFHRVPIVLVNRSEGVGYATGQFVFFYRPASLCPGVDHELMAYGMSDEVRVSESREGSFKWDYVIISEPTPETMYVRH